MVSLKKSSRVIELAIAFWIGVGLISIIDVWKISGGYNALNYSWIMFGVSIIFLAVCFIILLSRRKRA